ncbi:MAG: inorganic phosphate transporter [Deltaproteobacteria bacterium]|nr:inorganic phosphate transporter [Deltaproteobacteria bacterium]
MLDPFWLMVVVIALALLFDYINGFHDTANAIATVVSTNVLSPRAAVLLAALFNFAGAFLGTGVAKTIGGDIASPASVTQTVVLCALLAAIAWNLLTWWFGIPSSSSHTLVGGIVGSVAARRVLAEGQDAWTALSALLQSGGVTKVLKGLVFSPLSGFVVGLLMMVATTWVVRRLAPATVNKLFKRLQLVSASAMALSHGTNDAQKVMGIATMALFAYYGGGKPSDAPGWLDVATWQAKHELVVPAWVIGACAMAMAAGTAAGGWRIMRTMGSRIIRLKPIHGFCAETAGAVVLFTAAQLHAPVSTTHAISSSIMGVGASRRLSAVRWGVAGNMIVAWILTLPVSALLGAVAYAVLRTYFGP